MSAGERISNPGAASLRIDLSEALRLFGVVLGLGRAGEAPGAERANPTLRSLRLGVCRLSDRPLVVDALRRLRRSDPDLQLLVSEGSPAALSQALQRGQLDLAVAPGLLDVVGCRTEVLATERRYLAAPATHRLAMRSSVDGVDLAGERVLLGRGCLSWEAEAWLERLQHRGVIALSPQRVGLDSLLAMVRAGFGVALVERSGPVDDRLIFLPIDGPEGRVQLAVMWPRGGRRGPADQLLAQLHSARRENAR